MMNNLINIFVERWPDILTALGQHMQLALVSMLFVVVIAVPVGIMLTRYQKLAEPIIGVTSVFQTVPSLALLGFMIPILGIGFIPAIVALTIYGLLPVIRNTYTGIMGVDRAAVEAGIGMGMTSR